MIKPTRASLGIHGRIAPSCLAQESPAVRVVSVDVRFRVDAHELQAPVLEDPRNPDCAAI